MPNGSLLCLLESAARPDAAREDWERLYQRLWPYAFTIVFRSMGGNRSLAEEACQDVMLRLLVYSRLDTHAPHSFLSFVRFTCRSVVNEYRRKEFRTRGGIDPDALTTDGPSPETATIDSDLAENIRNRLTRNEVKLAELVGQGASVQSIAEELAISRESAYSRRYRLRKRVLSIARELEPAT